MNVQGKFYLLVNVGASVQSHYVQTASLGTQVRVTSDPYKAAFFDTQAQAEARQIEANGALEGEVILCQARKNLPAQVKA